MTTDTLSQIALDQLNESPFNPRKTFTAIDELAASIKSEGRVLSPLLVRPIIPPLFDAGAYTQPEAVAGYEIVFGHRRFRAAAAAGLASVPCMVRAMTDAEARSAQIAENLSRADVHPIEEAEGFQAMISHDGISADELAELVGKSRSYVYGRLKLLQAVPTVREACLRGEIGSEVALLVARVGPPKLQEKALARIKAVGASMQDGGQASFRRIKGELAQSFTLELKGAIFDREDTTLVPGASACSACPKRSGNSPLFADVATEGTSRWGGGPMHRDNGEPNRCTDPDCWDAKTKAHLARGAAKLEAEGKTVITGNKARQALDAAGHLRHGYLPLERLKAELKKSKQPLPVVHVQDQRTGKVVKAVRRDDLVAAGLAKPEKPPTKAQAESYSESIKREERERKERQQLADAQTEQRRRLLTAVRAAAAGRERTEFELRLVAAATLAAVQHSDWPTLVWLYGATFDQLRDRVDTMTVPELTQLLLDCAVVDHVQATAWRPEEPRPLLALAEHYGIDAQAAMQAPAQGAAESPAAEPAAAARHGQVAPKGAKYWCAETGQTWSGRGLVPAWLKAKVRGGAVIEDFLVGAKPAQAQEQEAAAEAEA